MSAIAEIPLMAELDLGQQVEFLRKTIKKITSETAVMEKKLEKALSCVPLARVNHRLCQKISRLEEENDTLRQTVATLDDKVTALSVKFDELENDSIVNDYLVNQRVDRSHDDIAELQVMVFPSHLTEYPQ